MAAGEPNTRLDSNSCGCFSWATNSSISDTRWRMLLSSEMSCPLLTSAPIIGISGPTRTSCSSSQCGRLVLELLDIGFGKQSPVAPVPAGRVLKGPTAEQTQQGGPADTDQPANLCRSVIPLPPERYRHICLPLT